MLLLELKIKVKGGTCWTFSTTGALEGYNYIKTNKLISLSEQILIDSDNIFKCGAGGITGGGYPSYAFDWIIKNSGYLPSEKEYPYISGNCISKNKKSLPIKYKNPTTNIITKKIYVPRSEQALMKAVNKQPISICIDINMPEFSSYKSGVFMDGHSAEINHTMLLVGYGTDSKTKLDYWLVKNSWGTSWGENGYIRIIRGNNPKTGKPYNNGAGCCGILNKHNCYPV